MICWFLAYLLIGFVFFSLGVLISPELIAIRRRDWRWELLAILLWPLSIAAAIFQPKNRMKL